MKYAKLGHSDLNVSRICLGCMGFGDAAHGQHSWTVDEPHTREIVKHALELGINFLIRQSLTRAAQASSISAGRSGILQNGMRLLLQRNSCPEHRRRLRQAYPASSTLNACWIKAFKTWAWITLIFISTICGITRPRCMI